MDPGNLTCAALLLGAIAGCGLAAAPGKDEATWAAPAAVLCLAGAPALLPVLDAGAARVSGASGVPVLGPLMVAALGGGLARALIPRVARARLPSPVWTAAVVAATLVPLVNGVAPTTHPVALGIAGGLLMLASALLPARSTARKPDPRGRFDGFQLGFCAAGVLPILLVAGGPLFGPSVGWYAEGITGLAVGVALAAALVRWAPAVRSPLLALLPLGVMGAGEMMLRGPEVVHWLTGHGVPALAGGAPLAASVATVAALALIGLLAGGAGPGTALGAGLGALAWIVLPDLAGPDLAVRAATVALAVASMPLLVGEERMWSRAFAGLAAAAALACLALPASPAGLRALAPYEAYSDPGRLGQLRGAAGWRTGEVRGSARGSAAVLSDLRPPVRWARGRSVAVDAESRGSAAFAAHLPALLTGDPPASILLVGAQHGALADSARRATAGPVVLAAPSSAHRWLITAHGGWNRDVAADPAVRIARVAPTGTLSSDAFGAVIVDLPPPWVPGAAADRSERGVRAVARRLRPGGIAVFRLPLASTSGDELAAFADSVCAVFAGVTAWLDPTGSEHLVFAARAEPGPVDGGAAFRTWSRRAVREELRASSLSSPDDVLDRLVTDRDGLLAMADGRARRSALGMAVVSGARVRSGRKVLPLGTLAAAGSDSETLVDLTTVPPEAVGPLRERLQATSRTRAEYLSMLEALATGDSMGALETARRIARSGASPVKDLKTLIRPWLDRCQSLREQGFLEQAKGECLVAHSFSPTDDEGSLLLADLHRLLDELDAAEVLYAEVRERNPTSPGALLGLASLAVLRGDLARAVALLEEAEALHPGNVLILNNLAAIHMRLAKRAPNDDEAHSHVERARGLFQAAAALEPRMPEPHVGLADLYIFFGALELALVEADRAVALDPRCPFRGLRGQVLMQLQRADEANTVIDQVLLDCPDDVTALTTKGDLMMDKGCYTQAAEQWRKVLRIAPGLVKLELGLQELEKSGLLEQGDRDCRP